MLLNEGPVLFWLSKQQNGFAKPVEVGLVLLEAQERVTFHFAAVSTDKSFQGITVHHKLEIVVECILTLVVIATEEGFRELCCLQPVLIHPVSRLQKLRQGNIPCKMEVENSSEELSCGEGNYWQRTP